MMTATPIGAYGMIGDTRSAALVSPDGSIDWLCLPRFDSPPVFGRLVGGEGAGYFSIAPAEPGRSGGQRYRGDTATLETAWDVEGGRLILADAMVSEVTGRMIPATLLVRRIVAEGRAIRVNVDLRPRFGYARTAGRSHRYRSALVIERAGTALAVMSDRGVPAPDTPVTLEVRPGEDVTISMSASHLGPAFFVPPATAAEEVRRDEARWKRWVDTLTIGPNHRAAMVRSFISLRLLTYSPSGAPVAAPTTSLPEHVGGVRNWDYRYAWPRDASLGITAFLGAGNGQEALGFLAWLVHASRLERPRLPALFTLDGRPAPRERTLATWPGYAGSRPVRVGNGAGTQHQLDGYGWVLDGAWRLTRAGHSLDGETWRTMRAFAEEVRRSWALPDAGIWERRDDPRHHVHSKLMAWLALDRAISIAEDRGGSTRYIRGWREARRLIGEEVIVRGYDRDLGSYTSAYGHHELDASLLLLPGIGLEAPGSPRMSGTIGAIRQQLGAGGPLLYRYRHPDGVPGHEGAFLPCSFWLVQALAQTGRRREAEGMFEELLELANPVGLFGEEMDPTTFDHLGNFPQALTHAALLQAGQALDE